MISDHTITHWVRGIHGELSYSSHGPARYCSMRYATTSTTSGIYGERAERIQAGLIEAGIPGIDMRQADPHKAVSFVFSGPMPVRKPGEEDALKPGIGLLQCGYRALDRAPLHVWLDLAGRAGCTVYNEGAAYARV